MPKIHSGEFESIVSGLNNTLASGKLGEPVALRLLSFRPPSERDAIEEIERLATLFVSVFGGSPTSLLARIEYPTLQPGSVEVRQVVGCHVLLKGPGATTASLTAILNSHPATPRLDLLLTGTHGVLRLEGSDALPLPPQAATGDLPNSVVWRETILKSAASARFEPWPSPKASS